MFVFSIRSATVKFAFAICLSLVLVFSLIASIPTYDGSKPVAKDSAGISYSKIYENADRIAFIEKFGWEVENTPAESVEVKIPANFDNIYTGYNEMQKEQGLNLAKYKGKTVNRYTYTVTNYPKYDGKVYINLLVYKNKIIAGDVCSADVTGFVHGFAMPRNLTSGSTV